MRPAMASKIPGETSNWQKRPLNWRAKLLWWSPFSGYLPGTNPRGSTGKIWTCLPTRPLYSLAWPP
jgi:hypothetical protein